jgi:hypothetical protein
LACAGELNSFKDCRFARTVITDKDGQRLVEFYRQRSPDTLEASNDNLLDFETFFLFF